MGNVGFLGTGVMGSRMSTRLAHAGHSVTVWNRTRGKAVLLLQEGAQIAETPAEASSGRDVVFANLTDAPALMSVISGPNGVLSAERMPGTLVDMATIAPHESAKIAEVLESRGIRFLRAPVSGTADVAAAGKLTILVSGEKEVFDAVDPYLAALGEHRYYIGSAEAARFLKLIHQMMIGVNMQVWAEGLVMGEKAGLDWDLMLEVLGDSAVGSGVVRGKIPSLRSRTYDPPAMNLHNIVKDLDLALRAGEEVDWDLPTTRYVRGLYNRALQAGLEWKDYSAVILEMERRAGLEPSESSS